MSDQTETRILPCKLSVEETNLRAVTSAANTKEIARLEEEKKQHTSRTNNLISKAKAETVALSEEILSKSTQKEVDCIWYEDPGFPEKVLRRTDTMAEVDRKPLETVDRELHLDFDSEEPGEVQEEPGEVLQLNARNQEVETNEEEPEGVPGNPLHKTIEESLYLPDEVELDPPE